MLAALLIVPATSASAAPSDLGPELADNGSFDAGTAGWRTNGPVQRLTVSDGHARLTPTSTSGVVLNDAEKTVAEAAAGSTYVVQAQVRTTTPGLNGALRVREVSDGQVISHRTTFRLEDTDWTSVELTFTTSRPDAGLDLNVLAWGLQPGEDLRIDDVSMRQSTGGSDPGDPVPAPPAPSPGDPCTSAPSTDTKFGASIYPVGRTPAQSLADIDSSFGRVPVIRDFHTGMPPAWNSPRSTLLRDREIVISFKATPSAILSGRHDSYLRNWFATAPENQTIYWSYMHEPEVKVKNGLFTPSQYRAAWRHIGALADQSCKPNMHSTLILTSWTIDPRSGRDYRDYDAGKDVVEVIAFDPYNALHDPQARTYTSAEDLIGPLAETMEADGRPWGLAELGSRIVVGDNGTGRAAWLDDVADVLIENDASFATYFQTTYKGVNFRLDDAPSRNTWRGLVQR
ncbi:carbohydrate binding domain-containing protein [uncultured Serinicoccus sp.]|uniref:carbohydrate binding domain-containing protein n=1 Tax=uncultured Serinicoccus sp. TaxID=735514 RepID=UPI002629CDB7|nr:carbohydrate binding domain-containing protein [uncultured Serinicoccus sp.]